MKREPIQNLRITLAGATLLLFALFAKAAAAGGLEVFHADSLAGPMQALKKAFESRHQGVTLNLHSGRSQELAERILKGDACDVFASSSPAVIDKDMLGRAIASTGKPAAAWYVVFSANEMVLITAKGNPLAIRRITDLARPGVKFARITGDKDLATARTIEFVKRAAALESQPDLAGKIIAGAAVDPSRPNTVPDTVRAVKDGKADAGIVYYSAAVAARDDLDIVRFPASVNISEEIRNAATVPGTARDAKVATEFVAFLLTDEGRRILESTGQPPVVPTIQVGDVPPRVKNP